MGKISPYKMRGFPGFKNSPLKEADNKLIEQSADIRKKAKEIEDEFIKNFTITKSSSRGLTKTEKQEIKELKKRKAEIRAANKKKRLDASLTKLNKKQNN